MPPPSHTLPEVKLRKRSEPRQKAINCFLFEAWTNNAFSCGSLFLGEQSFDIAIDSLNLQEDPCFELNFFVIHGHFISCDAPPLAVLGGQFQLVSSDPAPMYKPKKGHLEEVPQPDTQGTQTITMLIIHLPGWSERCCFWGGPGSPRPKNVDSNHAGDDINFAGGWGGWFIDFFFISMEWWGGTLLLVMSSFSVVVSNEHASKTPLGCPWYLVTGLSPLYK